MILLKLIITPLLIVATTLATRRWGHTIGGWLIGLPLTSGPVSVFLAMEQGREFAASSAHSTVNGLLGAVVFCIVYDACAKRCAWPGALAVSAVIDLLIIFLFTRVHPPLWGSVALAFAVITLGICLLRPHEGATPPIRAPYWDLPFRMVTTTTLVVGITAFSGVLGPQLSGLLATFPVFICVMSAFSHYLYGPAAIRMFERGVVSGSYAYAVFFIIVILALPAWNLFLVYSAATLGAVATNALVYAIQKTRRAAA